MNKIELEIEGMSCEHCVAAVSEALAELPGVSVEEVRVGGRVVMLKITPPGGTPYYLVDTAVPRDALDDGTRAPMWAILLFD